MSPPCRPLAKSNPSGPQVRIASPDPKTQKQNTSHILAAMSPGRCELFAAQRTGNESAELGVIEFGSGNAVVPTLSSRVHNKLCNESSTDQADLHSNRNDNRHQVQSDCPGTR